MESLALVAGLVVLSIIVMGVAAFVVAWRNPQRVIGRLVGIVIGAVAAALGSWLAFLTVGIGARVIGGVAAVAGIAAVVRSIRKG